MTEQDIKDMITDSQTPQEQRENLMKLAEVLQNHLDEIHQLIKNIQ
ncbi:hypothetical protein KC901_02940 [Patescibacteria group bacterium]|nr:hypothetical protein [Patescibacteria group bacterium]